MPVELFSCHMVASMDNGNKFSYLRNASRAFFMPWLSAWIVVLDVLTSVMPVELFSCHMVASMDNGTIDVLTSLMPVELSSCCGCRNGY